MPRFPALLALLSAAVLAWSSGAALAVQPEATPGLLKFSPPLRGAPASRVGGGARTMQTRANALIQLAPKANAFTTQTQPTLYWYMGRPATGKLTFTLENVSKRITMYQYTFDDSFERGIYGINLAAIPVNLSLEDQYEWSLRLHTGGTTEDLVVSAPIQRIKSSLSLQQALSNKLDATDAYSQEGVWYDALATISNQIDTNPADIALRSKRVDLLNQHNFAPVVAYDKGQQ